MLTEAKLRKRVYEATFKRGSSLFNAGGVLEMEEEDQGDRMLIRAKVQGSGSRAYDVELLMDESEDKILDYDCECPAYASFSGHVQALRSDSSGADPPERARIQPKTAV